MIKNKAIAIVAADKEITSNETSNTLVYTTSTIPTVPPTEPIDITGQNPVIPKTGDVSDILPWIVLMVVFSGAVSALGIKRKNRKAE